MTDPQDPNEFAAQDDAAATGKRKSGGTDDGTSTGITTARFSAQGIKLPPNKLKEVMGNWEYLDVAKAMTRMAEFFSELPARASANLQVSWANVNQRGFAVVNQAISFGQEVSQLMRERTAGAIKRLRTKYGIKIARPNTAAAPGAGPGMS